MKLTDLLLKFNNFLRIYFMSFCSWGFMLLWFICDPDRFISLLCLLCQNLRQCCSHSSDTIFLDQAYSFRGSQTAEWHLYEKVLFELPGHSPLSRCQITMAFSHLIQSTSVDSIFPTAVAWRTVAPMIALPWLWSFPGCPFAIKYRSLPDVDDVFLSATGTSFAWWGLLDSCRTHWHWYYQAFLLQIYTCGTSIWSMSHRVVSLLPEKVMFPIISVILLARFGSDRSASSSGIAFLW